MYVLFSYKIGVVVGLLLRWSDSLRVIQHLNYVHGTICFLVCRGLLRLHVFDVQVNSVMSEPNNPFSGLLGVSQDTPTNNPIHDDENSLIQASSKRTKENDENETANNIVENVFHITINPNALEGTTDRQLVFLEDLAEASKPRIQIDLEVLEQGLFERLLLPNPEVYVLPKKFKLYQSHVIQKLVFPYLFSSMQNLLSYDSNTSTIVKNVVQKMKELIFRNAVTALKQPALFEGQDFSLQLLELLQHVDPQSHAFFIDVVKAFMSDGKL